MTLRSKLAAPINQLPVGIPADEVDLAAEKLERVARDFAAEQSAALAHVEAMAERAQRHGYDLDPNDVLDAIQNRD